MFEMVKALMPSEAGDVEAPDQKCGLDLSRS
jgi:hypothetical protein